MDTWTRRGILVALTLLFLGSGFAAQPGDSAQSGTAEIQHLLDAQVGAWNRGDLDTFMSGYWKSPELTFFSGTDENHGWQAALDRYRKRYQGEGRTMGHLDFGELRIESLGADWAFVRGRWHLTMPDGSEPQGLFTLVLRRIPAGGWKIVHDHTS